MEINIINKINIDELNYLKNNFLLENLKIHLDTDDIRDLKNSPLLINKLIKFFEIDNNLDLLLDSLDSSFFYELIPNKIKLYEIDSTSHYISSLDFVFTYDINESFYKKAISKIKEINLFFDNNCDASSYGSINSFKECNIAIIHFSGYFDLTEDRINNFINYCNSKRYFYEFEIKNKTVRYKIKMRFKEDE